MVDRILEVRIRCVLTIFGRSDIILILILFIFKPRFVLIPRSDRGVSLSVRLVIIFRITLPVMIHGGMEYGMMEWMMRMEHVERGMKQGMKRSQRRRMNFILGISPAINEVADEKRGCLLDIGACDIDIVVCLGV